MEGGFLLTVLSFGAAGLVWKVTPNRSMGFDCPRDRAVKNDPHATLVQDACVLIKSLAVYLGLLYLPFVPANQVVLELCAVSMERAKPYCSTII
jgi:hypothetical protein